MLKFITIQYDSQMSLPGGSLKRWTEMDSKCTTPTISRYCRSFSLYNVCDLRHEKAIKRAQAENPVHMLNWAVRSVKFLGVEFDQSEDEEVSVSDAAHL